MNYDLSVSHVLREPVSIISPCVFVLHFPDLVVVLSLFVAHDTLIRLIFLVCMQKVPRKKGFRDAET